MRISDWSSDVCSSDLRHHLQASVRNDNISGYGNQATGGLAYDLDLDDRWRVGVAGNTGFRAPSFTELYWPLRYGFVGNPNLEPEKSRNIEASVRYTSDATRLRDRKSTRLNSSH